LWFVVDGLWLSFFVIQISLMATIQKFEDLKVWQLARELSRKIYPLTFQKPIAKDISFKDQIRGTCGSIMDNIAEGF
jgi:hypothetical protein